jgi:hypothetical protein
MAQYRGLASEGRQRQAKYTKSFQKIYKEKEKYILCSSYTSILVYIDVREALPRVSSNRSKFQNRAAGVSLDCHW